MMEPMLPLLPGLLSISLTCFWLPRLGRLCLLLRKLLHLFLPTQLSGANMTRTRKVACHNSNSCTLDMGSYLGMVMQLRVRVI